MEEENVDVIVIKTEKSSNDDDGMDADETDHEIMPTSIKDENFFEKETINAEVTSNVNFIDGPHFGDIDQLCMANEKLDGTQKEDKMVKKKKIRSKAQCKKVERPSRAKGCTCSECGQWFKHMLDRKSHRLQEHDGQYKCTYEGCDKLFKDRCNRKKHITNVHHSFRKYQCHKCASLFKTSSTLHAHMYNMHTDVSQKKEYKCDVCPKVFYSNNGFSQHLSLHTGEKPFVCSMEGCGKTFRLKSTAVRHENHAHLNLKQHECSECHQMFSRKTYLRTHMYKHTGIKPFECGQCGKTFTQKGNLDTHKKMHSGSRSAFMCHMCSRIFTVKSNYTKHMITCHKNPTSLGSSNKKHRITRVEDDAQSVYIHVGSIEDQGEEEADIHDQSNAIQHQKVLHIFSKSNDEQKPIDDYQAIVTIETSTNEGHNA